MQDASNVGFNIFCISILLLLLIISMNVHCTLHCLVILWVYYYNSSGGTAALPGEDIHHQTSKDPLSISHELSQGSEEGEEEEEGCTADSNSMPSSLIAAGAAAGGGAGEGGGGAGGVEMMEQSASCVAHTHTCTL
jgi:hypothetical protein